MTPTIPHILLTIHGGMPGGETWSCGLRTLAWATALTDAGGTTLAVNVSNRWRAFNNTAIVSKLFGNCTGSSTRATIDGTTVRRVDEDGLTVEQYEGSPTTALVAAGSQTGVFPNQNALVVSLISARAGRTGKGRIYLPCIMGPLMGTNGRAESAEISAIANAAKVLLDGINTDLRTATDGAMALAVQSSKASAEPGVWTPGAPAGYMGAKIISVRVGDVVDTQRRRRSSIAENYSTVQLAA